MLIGISTALQHTSPIQWAEQMAELGCKSVVFPVDYTASDKEIQAYVQAAKEYGLLIAEVGIWRNPLAMDVSRRQEARERSAGQLRLAEAIGAKCCVNVAGTMGGPVWDGGYPENYSKETWAATVEYTQELIDEVKPVKTSYCLEPMPWMIPDGPDECLKLIEEVDRECFKVHLDFVNMINTPHRYFFADEFMQECFDKLGKYICSCHLKDIRLRPEFTFQLEEVACGQGSLHIEKYITLANQYNLDMPIIVEHLNTDGEYRESMVYLKNRLSEKGLW